MQSNWRRSAAPPPFPPRASWHKLQRPWVFWEQHEERDPGKRWKDFVRASVSL